MKQKYTAEKIAVVLALFLFAFGTGLMVDGRKLYANQLRTSQRVDYRSTLNPYQ